MDMDEMVNSLKGKKGAELDNAFLHAMIEHHQGAIDMANEIKDNTEREELKQMAAGIIDVQQKEIDMMRQWMAEWGHAEA